MEPDAMGCGKCIINGFIYCDYDYDCRKLSVFCGRQKFEAVAAIMFAAA